MYEDAFSPKDRELLARLAGVDQGELAEELSRRPWMIHDLLARPDLLDSLLEAGSPPAETASPFLLFSAIVHRAAAELREATYVNDWTGPKVRLPVFDVAPLHEFLADPGRTFFLAALLASFAVPEAPPVPARGPLDLHGIALWLDQALPADRVTLLRKLGDLALFLTGVFPDRTGSSPLRPVDAQRLARTAGLTVEELLSTADPGTLAPGLAALESLGARWYEAAAAAGVGAEVKVPSVLLDVAARFSSARRVLNHLTDRYLYRFEPRWKMAA